MPFDACAAQYWELSEQSQNAALRALGCEFPASRIEGAEPTELGSFMKLTTDLTSSEKEKLLTAFAAWRPDVLTPETLRLLAAARKLLTSGKLSGDPLKICLVAWIITKEQNPTAITTGQIVELLTALGVTVANASASIKAMTAQNQKVAVFENVSDESNDERRRFRITPHAESMVKSLLSPQTSPKL